MGARTLAMIACGLALAAAAPARAQPARAQPGGAEAPGGCAAVQVDRCDGWLDVDALRRAVETEGVACSGAAIACDGGRLAVNGVDTGHDLGPMPAAVRDRIVALLVAERLRALGEVSPRRPASPAGAGPGASSAGPAGSADTTGPTPTEAPAADGDEPTTAPAAPGRTTGVGELAAPTPPRSAVGPRARPTALVDGADAALGSAPRLLLGAGADVRAYVDPWTALVGPVAHVSVGAFVGEVGWGFGRADGAPAGDVALSLGHLSVGARVACVAWVEGGVCASALATVGLARAVPDAEAGARGDTAAGAYGGAMAEVVGWLSTEHVVVSLGLRGGWGHGLVVRANAREVASLGGAWIGARLGLDVGVRP